jgi:type IV secretory pathway VirB4 component
MSKIVKLSSATEREKKLNEIYENMEELKNQFAALIDEYEEEESGSRKVDTLIEALDALEDAAEAMQDVLER